MIFENISLAITALLSNKMRSILTMLGIIIGISSVIAIMTIGDAMTETVNSAFAAFGTGNINVTVREQNAINRNNMVQMPGGMGMVVMTGGRGTFFAPQDYELISDVIIEEFREAFPDEVAGVVLTHQGKQGAAWNGDLFANISVTGTNPDYILANNVTMLSGRFLSDSDLEDMRSVAVVSDRFVSNMFPDGRDPIGEQVSVYFRNSIEIFTIIGVYRHEAMGFGFSFGPAVPDREIRTPMYIPFTTARQDVRNRNHQAMTVVAARGVNVIEFTDTIIDYFAEVYRYNNTWGVDATNMESILEEAMAALNAISIAVAAIAAISLLVGGIGIMNIMLVSVTERTKEIGIRKALGAKNRHIRLQFITESAIIAAIGGVIGATLGTLIGLAAMPVFSMIMETEMELVVSWGVIALSVAFSAIIGMFFGYYPANKAAKLNPIDALRYE
ncbi:MAG: ABC transporter permease [Defluviitaleaceae bacterium]|nr:ABC transporter permease [Defluviitaleaceae bacterium]